MTRKEIIIALENGDLLFVDERHYARKVGAEFLVINRHSGASRPLIRSVKQHGKFVRTFVPAPYKLRRFELNEAPKLPQITNDPWQENKKRKAMLKEIEPLQHAYSNLSDPIQFSDDQATWVLLSLFTLFPVFVLYNMYLAYTPNGKKYCMEEKENLQKSIKIIKKRHGFD